MDLQYKANPSSATTAQMEEDVTPAPAKCQKFHIKPVTIPPLVLTEVKISGFPAPERAEAAPSQKHPWYHEDHWVSHFAVPWYRKVLALLNINHGE